jgi:hypothetical protein
MRISKEAEVVIKVLEGIQEEEVALKVAVVDLHSERVHSEVAMKTEEDVAISLATEEDLENQEEVLTVVPLIFIVAQEDWTEEEECVEASNDPLKKMKRENLDIRGEDIVEEEDLISKEAVTEVAEVVSTMKTANLGLKYKEEVPEVAVEVSVMKNVNLGL